MPGIYFVGVDVGTGSARASLVNAHGRVLQMHVRQIETWNPLPDHYEQSSDNIWRAVCECVHSVTKGYPSYEIAGIGFAATCSLVVLDKDNEPLSISTTGNNNQNIVLWMDHRAAREANTINKTNHDLLKYVGGNVSLEMQCPKLLWLKRNMYLSCWNKIGKVFDLADYLTWKCTGEDVRSLCSVVCKWNYDGLKNCWSTDFFKTIDLEEVCKNNFEMLGRRVHEPGTTIAHGLTERAAEEFGLLAGTPVAVPLIDAHAGALCLFGSNAEDVDSDVSSKMALICGTSSCHMSVSPQMIWTPGVWGPYKGAIFPHLFLHEGGQSATGVLLDFVVKNHPAYEQALSSAGQLHIFEYLNKFLLEIAVERKLPSLHHLTRDIHIWPDFHGNRSPLADSNIKGMICGATMDASVLNLAVYYLAFVQAIAFGTRHILDALRESGRQSFKSLLLCGGLSKNPIFIEAHAEACNLPILLPNESETVLVGAAMLASCGAKVYDDIHTAAKQMSSKSKVIWPKLENTEFYKRKYEVFKRMILDQKSYDAIMNN